jgi:hypothetical protein
MEPKLENSNLVAGELKIKVFVFNDLKTFQFGLLRAFNHSEPLFIRPRAPEGGRYRSGQDTAQRYSNEFKKTRTGFRSCT